MESKILLANIEQINKACSKAMSFVENIVDDNSFVETDVFLTGKGFDSAVDALGEGVITGYATIGGRAVHLFAHNENVLKGSLSKAQADKIYKAMQRAIKSGTPFVSIVDSCGARIGEGTSIMEGYSKLIRGCAEMASVIPHICIVKGVAVGMMATYVAGADWTFMSKDAVVSFGSPMAVLFNNEAIVTDYASKLGYNGYKSNSDLANFGYTSNKDLKAQVNNLLKLVMPNDEDVCEDDANRIDPKISKYTVEKMVASICDKDTTLDFCPNYATDVKCYLSKLNGIAVGIIANDGDYMSEKGIEKAIAFVNKLEAYDMPLITLVDTMGVKSTLSMEYNNIAKKTFDLMATISNSGIAKIGVAVGKAIGYGYSALMSKSIGFDYTLATNNAVISPVDSSVVVVGMMNDQLAKAANKPEMKEKLEKQYENLSANAILSAQDGYIDNVIEAKNLRPYIASALLMILGI